MPSARPTTVASYLNAAPPSARPHLKRLYALLKEAAPDAQATIKWNTPFFVRPRFLFAFAANKAHLGFTTTSETLAPFREELKDYEVTKMGILKIRYADPLPEDLIRRIAEHRVARVSEREDDGFWDPPERSA